MSVSWLPPIGWAQRSRYRSFQSASSHRFPHAPVSSIPGTFRGGAQQYTRTVDHPLHLLLIFIITPPPAPARRPHERARKILLLHGSCSSRTPVQRKMEREGEESVSFRRLCPGPCRPTRAHDTVVCLPGGRADPPRVCVHPTEKTQGDPRKRPAVPSDLSPRAHPPPLPHHVCMCRPASGGACDPADPQGAAPSPSIAPATPTAVPIPLPVPVPTLLRSSPPADHPYKLSTFLLSTPSLPGGIFLSFRSSPRFVPLV